MEREDISWPTNARHVSHLTFDRYNGFLGLPIEFETDVPSRVPSARFHSHTLFVPLFVCFLCSNSASSLYKNPKAITAVINIPCFWFIVLSYSSSFCQNISKLCNFSFLSGTVVSLVSSVFTGRLRIIAGEIAVHQYY
uniref:CRIB domain-containing protein n=1 Tax=Nelumbo nucifera TaxID=4432 RepID=A0A822YRE6_NELNU|nr:TPA_asm: hypothetical protein HUJ06_012217 [Nelumbo nucifera]